MSKFDLEKLMGDKDTFDRFNEYLKIKTQTPFLLSTLAEALALETWDYRQALLLMVGIEPSGADVEWLGYENYAGVWIENPTIRNAAFLDAKLPDYTTPTDFSYNGDKDHFKGDKSIEDKIKLLNDASVRLQYLFQHWNSAAKSHSNKNSPSYYIEWALSKKYDIQWLDFVIERGFYKPKQLQEIESKPLADKDRAHISNNLAALNQAAAKFWANADRNDDTTHPINASVAAWLIDRGYSATLADKGATIIRPEWASNGRKADK